jgi:hypothetical protein
MRGTYTEYQNRIQEDIRDCVNLYNTQPVIFAGAGLSKRYFSGPSWDELLEWLSEFNAIEQDIEFHLQDKNNDEPLIGSEFAQKFKNWAWENKDEFQPWLFTREAPEDIYIKYKISDYFRERTPSKIEDADSQFIDEINLLQNIQPHAVITTNYDKFLERVFPDYFPVIGERIVNEPYSYIGEIYKIHGCISKPSELVLTKEDYQTFMNERRYLSAKLLTYFTEHPVLIVGYEPSDENVKRILRDVKMISSSNDRSNIYIVDYQRDIPESGNFDQERLIDVGEGEQMIINYICANDFEWIYDAFSEGGEISGVNIKLLRRLMNNTYEIVSEDAPKREINFEQLQASSENRNQLATLFGITPLGESGVDLSDTGVSVSLDDAGMPVTGLVTDDPVDDINDKLATAVSSWRSNDALISQRNPIYTFYRRREELDLDNSRVEFLLRSSLKNIFFGAVWIEAYDGDPSQLLRDIQNDINGTHLTAYEPLLLALGEQEILDEISSNDDFDFISSDAEEYASYCEYDPLERAREYVGDSIEFQDNSYTIEDLYGELSVVDDLLNDIVSELLKDDGVTNRRHFRMVEFMYILSHRRT